MSRQFVLAVPDMPKSINAGGLGELLKVNRDLGTAQASIKRLEEELHLRVGVRVIDELRRQLAEATIERDQVRTQVADLESRLRADTGKGEPF